MTNIISNLKQVKLLSPQQDILSTLTHQLHHKQLESLIKILNKQKTKPLFPQQKQFFDPATFGHRQNKSGPPWSPNWFLFDDHLMSL